MPSNFWDIFTPDATQKKLKYIKPSVMVGDIIIWKEGLLPYHQFFDRTYCGFSGTRENLQLL